MPDELISDALEHAAENIDALQDSAAENAAEAAQDAAEAAQDAATAEAAASEAVVAAGAAIALADATAAAAELEAARIIARMEARLHELEAICRTLSDQVAATILPVLPLTPMEQSPSIQLSSEEPEAEAKAPAETISPENVAGHSEVVIPAVEIATRRNRTRLL